MKNLFAPAMLAFALVLAGCESLSEAKDSIREKLAARDQPQTRVYPDAAPRAVYEAARIAIGQMDFRFLRGGAAQGELDALNSVSGGAAPHSAHQISLKVRLHGTSDGGTEANVWLKEVIESDSANHAGTATETPLRDTPLYDTFFRNLQRAIDAQKKG
jgi:hypothetical protein